MDEEKPVTMSSIESADILIIILYFIIISAIGLFYSRNQNETSSNYFLANRNLGWFVIGTSLFAATISSESFIFLAGSGANNGLAVGNLECMAIIPLMLLGWCFAPLFLKSGIFTVPEFFGRRFNNATRLYLSGITILSYLFIRVSLSLLAGGVLFKAVFGWDVYSSAIVMVVITGFYTIVGGLRAVVYTSVFQTFFLIIGAILLTIFGLNEVGGIYVVQENLPAAHFLLFKPLSDPDFPWLGIMLATPILGIWYWCTEQYVVQRILGAKSVTAARRGTILTGFLIILPVFILVFPGLIAAALFPGVSGEEALSTLLYSSVLPVGIKGIVLVGIISALMASLATTFISASTLITMDYYRYLKPTSHDKQQVLVGRLSTTAVVMAAILWIPLVKNLNNQILNHIHNIPAFIGPPVAVVFLLGIFWKQMNSSGALAALISGGLLGMIRLLRDFLDPTWVSGIEFIDNVLVANSLYYAVVLFVVSALVMIFTSFLTKSFTGSRIGETLIYLRDLKLIIKGRMSSTQGEIADRPGWLLSVFLLGLLVGLWGLFL